MAVIRSLFRNVSAHVNEPHLIVGALNESMSENNELNMFATLFVGVLDLATGHLDYCNAGHDAPLLIGQGVGPLPCDPNLPVGVMPDWQFTLQQVTLDPQTTIFLYTDGLNEAENILHAQFGDDRIISLAETLLNRGQNQPSTLIQLMTDAVHDFVGQAEQSDDLTMLAIQYKR
jgi:sigma-B regulation protein RsbU (phosphoserine phosphatase)